MREFVPVMPSHPCRADIIRQIEILELAAKNLAGYELNHPDVQMALASLGHNRSLMRVLLAARLAHHSTSQQRLTRVLAEEVTVADSQPAVSAIFAEGL